ncbi:DUF5006 domain-containing protein [uncultured Bacteroides sp.]|uniref:DUF5006 domain-containing protein n=1 Tax=uncultured Bacteroides sp. TaxID=162156 RepID=UPI0025E05F95|nr:DUF5006 domain-containing protein [uncultured Bacteroides sp.]
MKKILRMAYLWTLLLIVVGLSGCSDDEPIAPLAEPVPLKMSLNSKDLVMGEVMEITFDVTGTEEGKKVMNEDLNIRLSAKTNRGAVDQLLFDDFPATVTLSKGETSKTVHVPVKQTGINREHNVELSAFARGYRMAGALQVVTISDFHYSKVSLKNNADKTVKEGQSFILVASVNSKLLDELTITIVPKEGEEERYVNLPSELVIPAGKSSVESAPIIMKKDENTKEDEELTLNLSTIPVATRYPLNEKQLIIKKIDVHKSMDTEVRDERWLYEDADLLFVSEKNEAALKSWGQTNYTVMKEGDPHPNNGNVLPKGKWKFFRAYEFHKISGCVMSKESNDGEYTSEEHPVGLADQNTGAVETQGAVDNVKFSWVTDEGYLRMISLKDKAKSSNTGNTFEFGTSAFYSCKFQRGNPNSPKWPAANVRIYPGMRIETRARIRGAHNSGMLPGIWLQGNEQVGGNAQWNGWPDFGEIDVMENNTKHPTMSYRTSVEQTFHLGDITPNTGKSKISPTVAVTDIAGTIGEFHIYWVEWVDNQTVRMGVNGKQTIELTQAEAERQGARWPFTDQVNSEGLYYILTMMFLHKAKPDYPSMEMSYLTARRMLKNNPDALIPRMEVDWVRFYIDDTYSDHGMPWRDDVILY